MPNLSSSSVRTCLSWRSALVFSSPNPRLTPRIPRVGYPRAQRLSRSAPPHTLSAPPHTRSAQPRAPARYACGQPNFLGYLHLLSRSAPPHTLSAPPHTP